MDIDPQKVVRAAEADESSVIDYFKVRLKYAAIAAGTAGLIVGLLLGHFI